MITSKVETRGNHQTLTINGNQQENLAYITYLPDNGCFADFAKAGYRLYSACVFFGSNKMNEYSGFDIPGKGMFDGAEPDFSDFDRVIGEILKACPDVDFICSPISYGQLPESKRCQAVQRS